VAIENIVCSVKRFLLIEDPKQPYMLTREMFVSSKNSRSAHPWSLSHFRRRPLGNPHSGSSYIPNLLRQYPALPHRTFPWLPASRGRDDPNDSIVEIQHGFKPFGSKSSDLCLGHVFKKRSHIICIVWIKLPSNEVPCRTYCPFAAPSEFPTGLEESEDDEGVFGERKFRKSKIPHERHWFSTFAEGMSSLAAVITEDCGCGHFSYSTLGIEYSSSIFTSSINNKNSMSSTPKVVKPSTGPTGEFP